MRVFCRWSSSLLYLTLLYFAKNVLWYSWNWWDIFAFAYLYFAVLMGDWTPRGSWSWPSRFWLRNLSSPSFDTNIKNSITPKFPGFMSYWATEIEGKSRIRNILGGHFKFNIICICSAATRLIIYVCYETLYCAQSLEAYCSCKVRFIYASIWQGARSTGNFKSHLASQLCSWH